MLSHQLWMNCLPFADGRNLNWLTHLIKNIIRLVQQHLPELDGGIRMKFRYGLRHGLDVVHGRLYECPISVFQAATDVNNLKYTDRMKKEKSMPTDGWSSRERGSKYITWDMKSSWDSNCDTKEMHWNFRWRSCLSLWLSTLNNASVPFFFFSRWGSLNVFCVSGIECEQIAAQVSNDMGSFNSPKKNGDRCLTTHLIASMGR